MNNMQKFITAKPGLFWITCMILTLIFIAIGDKLGSIRQTKQIQVITTYPGFIVQLDNPDLAGIEIQVANTNGMYSYQTSYYEPIIFLGLDKIMYTTTDSGKTWHKYNPEEFK